MGADAVVPIRLAGLARDHQIAGDEAIGREESRAQLIVVDHPLPEAVDRLGLDQGANGRGLGRDPHRASHHVADHTWPHVRAFVAIVFVAVRGLLGAPAADGGAPARERDALFLVLHVDVEAGVTLARLWVARARRIPGQVVPDLAAIDHDGQIHVGPVVLGQGRQVDRCAQMAKIGSAVPLEKGQRSLGAGQAELLDRGLGHLLD